MIDDREEMMPVAAARDLARRVVQDDRAQQLRAAHSNRFVGLDELARRRYTCKACGHVTETVGCGLTQTRCSLRVRSKRQWGRCGGKLRGELLAV